MKLQIDVPNTETMNADDQALVQGFAKAMAKRLIVARNAGRNGWKSNDWRQVCLQRLIRNLEHGDLVDSANYLAFMWYHGWEIGPENLAGLPIIGPDDKIIVNFEQAVSKETFDRIHEQLEEAVLSDRKSIALAGGKMAILRGKGKRS